MYTLFCERLSEIKNKGIYPKVLISQIEKIERENHGKIPKGKLYLVGAGIHTISKLLSELGYKDFDIYAPEGSKSPVREIILR